MCSIPKPFPPVSPTPSPGSRIPTPLPPSASHAPKAPGAEPAAGGENITIMLKSGRNPKMELTLSDLPASTTIQSLKEAVQTRLGGASVVSTEKVKILINKKPIPTSKTTVADAFAGGEMGTEIEMGVMVMGGAPDPPSEAADVPKPATPVPTAVAEGEAMEGVERTDNVAEKVHGVLSGSQFWADLEAFLVEKLSHGDSARRVRTMFENSWQSSNSTP